MFKVGDKVKVITQVWWIDRYYTNKIGIVININLDGGFRYTVSMDTAEILVDEHEIEKAVKKNQQLLFEFMSE